MGQRVRALIQTVSEKRCAYPFTHALFYLEESTCMIFVSVDEMTEEECAPVVQ